MTVETASEAQKRLKQFTKYANQILRAQKTLDKKYKWGTNEFQANSDKWFNERKRKFNHIASKYPKEITQGCAHDLANWYVKHTNVPKNTYRENLLFDASQKINKLDPSMLKKLAKTIEHEKIKEQSVKQQLRKASRSKTKLPTQSQLSKRAR